MKNNQKNIALIINEESKFPSDYTECLVSDMDSIPVGSCDNLYIGDILDYLAKEDIHVFLTNAMQKIRKENGSVHIKAPDILQTCWYASRMNIDIKDLRYILYDTKRTNCYTLDEIVEIVNSIPNTTINSASYANGYEYSLSLNTHEN